MNRRRLLRILAATALAPLAAWGQDRRLAMGAEAELTLYGPPDLTAHVRDLAWAELARLESLFSLYDPTSALSRLNAAGRLADPAPEMREILALCESLHEATRGRFDPTVQPLWLAHANGQDPRAARALLGWEQVTLGDDAVTLGPGQRLTLNGIAQGYATDRVTQLLAREGLTHALVEIGEFRALFGPFTLGVEDPIHGRLGQVTLNGTSCATSSPGAMTLPDGTAHILDPRGGVPVWSTVSVRAPAAALADGLSTALTLADPKAARGILARFGPDVSASGITPSGDLLQL